MCLALLCPSIDKLVKRIPNCYSFSILLDASALPDILDPAHPLVLRDMAAPAHDPADDAPAEGGLARFPLLFSYPPGRPLVQKWNLVSTLIASADLYHSGLSADTPRQTTKCVLALGPSHLPTDVCVWDFASEVDYATRHGGCLPPNSTSYFLAKVDIGKTAYIVVTLQANTSILNGDKSDGGTTSTSTTEVDPLPHSTSSISTPTHGSTVSQHPPAGSIPPPSAVPPTGAMRKRIFDQLLADVSPILHYLRHMHVFQQMQPALGKRKN